MIALLGGTFDPIHLGHTELASTILAHYSPTKVYLVPANRNPHKGEASVSAEHRLRMVKLALAELREPRIECLDWEAHAKGPSYTIDTLQRLRTAGLASICLVMGDEVFASLPRWKLPKRILALASLIVVTRQSVTPSVDPVLKQIGVDPGTVNIQIHPMQTLPVSGTQIREDIRRFGNLPDFMPQGIQRSVWQYIKENRLYAVDHEVGTDEGISKE